MKEEYYIFLVSDSGQRQKKPIGETEQVIQV